MWSSLLDLFFPRKSLTGDEGDWVTVDELTTVRFDPVLLTSAELRAQGVRSLDRVIACGHYGQLPLLKKAIHLFKYKRVPDLQLFLGTLLTETSYSFWHNASPVLCPVPLHWSRTFWRGFNQAELLANAVAHERHVGNHQLLKRVRPTGHQAWRGREERLSAMQSAFAVKRKGTVPPHVILVDDLFTTGATMDACAEVLRREGAERVEGLVLALG